MNRPSRLLVIVLAAALSACALGERPRLGEPVDKSKPLDRQAFGDPVVDAVLGPLDKVDSLTFTAVYRVTNLSTSTKSDAVVVHEPTRHVVTVGDTVLYFSDQTKVCSVLKATCAPGDLNQPISALIPSGHEFYSARAAQQLRVSARRAAAKPFASEILVLDQTATCVVVPLATDGSKDETYCVLPNGHLARVERADVEIDLVSVTPTADPAAFVPIG